MRKTYKLNDTNYEIIENYKDGFVFNELESKFTDYFYDYDYVLDDWAYGKLRLKGFYDEENKKCNKINNIKNLKDHIKNNCSYDCRYFLIKKVK